MIQTTVFNPAIKPSLKEKESLIDFLFDNLQEYGDPKSDIEKCVDYALKETTSFGGFILVSYLENEISGVVIVNQTGMKDYIPENILVYIATHKNHRGKGIGKELMKKAIDLTEGSIALHVEPENPARFLYEKVGFSSKYIEMRLKK
ncbi:N-acetyltransferase [Ancylomarina euxinus]|uniref:N-acetyltransferase n=1 Tax=Ancylomarina euxinus TaxID=2283627 RepID=A0A425Y2X6_9BACT|nr:GNAT family N-acetyltransferase [Ancylomarina euxinus]MCZ4693207.1 GNAT family N-acetyltransferase [Ancylomarina euxinus]MUP15343.1 GNAT family N-acetyltransferase [Ancylomarina euxinus]RRG22531.1 N-acetyltransferase [Ancylomarina euxinus]